ncbi:hypothetical protein BU23DRAFT_560558 [Bimuria novae-zelandiae CBS 107.79]|uniref:DUF7587 domain-containing protein n=1 Tax=Bimuria novae-zelandiae CBS 107.79 TaxID=1447943 RepID=A0A6A5UME2_9PLEO|nr:hypothetical protein BU23DRAFT_560558 [Bimuria novae-zelandiae CBS 107.79]
MSAESPAPPSVFYRAQHRRSFTHYDSQYGFEAQGRYLMDYSHWINKQKIESHLNRNARPLEPTPFISVFDNRASANSRAQIFRNRGYRDVFIAEIRPGGLECTSLPLRFFEGVVDLPAWIAPEGTIFLSSADLRRYLHVDVAISDRHEWLAIEWIPASMIRVI